MKTLTKEQTGELESAMKEAEKKPGLKFALYNYGRYLYTRNGSVADTFSGATGANLFDRSSFKEESEALVQLHELMKGRDIITEAQARELLTTLFKDLKSDKVNDAIIKRLVDQKMNDFGLRELNGFLSFLEKKAPKAKAGQPVNADQQASHVLYQHVQEAISKYKKDMSVENLMLALADIDGAIDAAKYRKNPELNAYLEQTLAAHSVKSVFLPSKGKELIDNLGQIIDATPQRLFRVEGKHFAENDATDTMINNFVGSIFNNLKDANIADSEDRLLKLLLDLKKLRDQEGLDEITKLYASEMFNDIQAKIKADYNVELSEAKKGDGKTKTKEDKKDESKASPKVEFEFAKSGRAPTTEELKDIAEKFCEKNTNYEWKYSDDKQSAVITDKAKGFSYQMKKTGTGFSISSDQKTPVGSSPEDKKNREDILQGLADVTKKLVDTIDEPVKATITQGNLADRFRLAYKLAVDQCVYVESFMKAPEEAAEFQKLLESDEDLKGHYDKYRAAIKARRADYNEKSKLTEDIDRGHGSRPAR